MLVKAITKILDCQPTILKTNHFAIELLYVIDV